MHPSSMHPSPVHAAASITGREPGEQEHEGRYDEFSRIALLAWLALKGVDAPIDAAGGQRATAEIARPSLSLDRLCSPTDRLVPG